MRTSFILLFSFFISQHTLSQNRYKLYGATFRASEILGAGQSFGPFEQDHKTEFFGNRKITNDRYDILGQYYETSNMISTTNLLNKYSFAKQPVLDEINIRYYYENGFENIRLKDPSLSSNSTFQKFKQNFIQLYREKKMDELRDSLYNDNNNDFRIALEKTRYTTTREITFNLLQDQTRKISLGIGAEIKAIIEKYINLTGTLEAKLSDSIKVNVTVNNAKYYETGLNKDYVSVSKIVITKYDKNRDFLKNAEDVFSKELLTFLESNNTAIITGAAILAIAIDYSKYQKLITNIGIVLAANGLKDSDITSLKADLDAMFKSTTNRTFSTTSGITYYNLRYGYSKKLEIGNSH